MDVFILDWIFWLNKIYMVHGCGSSYFREWSKIRNCPCNSGSNVRFHF